MSYKVLFSVTDLSSHRGLNKIQLWFYFYKLDKYSYSITHNIKLTWFIAEILKHGELSADQTNLRLVHIYMGIFFKALLFLCAFACCPRTSVVLGH